MVDHLLLGFAEFAETEGLREDVECLLHG
jgi:hypothetical protein